jgi:hypothetical protein
MSATITSLPVEFLFSITANTGDPTPVVIPRAGGNLTVITVMSGTFEGPAMRGRVLPVAGGDWISVRDDGSMRLDVRIVLETDDGALVFMTYGGVGVTGADGSLSLRTAPLFETADDRYTWLNHLQALAIGTVAPGTVTYQVYRLL